MRFPDIPAAISQQTETFDPRRHDSGGDCSFRLYRDDALLLITGNEFIVREERQIFHPGLCREKAVKRVFLTIVCLTYCEKSREWRSVIDFWRGYHFMHFEGIMRRVGKQPNVEIRIEGEEG